MGVPEHGSCGAGERACTGARVLGGKGEKETQEKRLETAERGSSGAREQGRGGMATGDFGAGERACAGARDLEEGLHYCSGRRLRNYPLMWIRSWRGMPIMSARNDQFASTM